MESATTPSPVKPSRPFSRPDAGACTTTTTVTTGGKNWSVSVTKKEPNYNVVAIIEKVLVDSLVRPIIGEGMRNHERPMPLTKRQRHRVH